MQRCVRRSGTVSVRVHDTAVEQPTHTDKSRSSSSSSTIPDAYPESKDRILAALPVLGEKSGDSIVTQCMCSRRGQLAMDESTGVQGTDGCSVVRTAEALAVQPRGSASLHILNAPLVE
jgi:hypothetical protein